MKPDPLSALFVLHGAPGLLLEPDVPAHALLAGLSVRSPLSPPAAAYHPAGKPRVPQ